MTVSSTSNRKSYAGDGVTASFATSPVIFFNSSELVVYDVVTATGVVTATLTENTNYTVSGGSGVTGTVNLAAGSSPYGAPAAGHTLLIVRTLPLTQTSDLVNNDNSDAEVVEDSLDKLTMVDQQQAAQIARSFVLADSDVSGASTVLPTPTATSLLGWNSGASALVNYSTSTLALALTTAYTLTLLDDPTAVAARATLGLADATAVGDILTATAAGAFTRKAVGTDGYTLRPSSTAGDGLAWTGPSNFDILNGSLTASVAASALTVALKGLDGNDPSAANPVFIAFRSATAATGTPTIIKVAAATSIVVSSGSTLGTSNAVAARLWIVGFNDAGTFRMGIVNTLSGMNIMPLRDHILASSTAEGGAGAADSAQVIYTGTAVTTKAMRILGYVEATEATAGTWATAPSVVQLFGPGVSLPGSIIQRQRSQDAAGSNGTTILPYDDTIPQITEGVQFMTQAITPISAANVLSIEHHGLYGANVDTEIISVALFQDATAGALAAAQAPSVSGANGTVGVTTLNHQMVAGTIVSTTFRIRAGPAGANTVSFNGAASARRYGGVAASSLTVQEIMV